MNRIDFLASRRRRQAKRGGERKGAVADSNDKRAALSTLLKQLLAYVQMMADGDVETAATRMQSAGIAVKKVSIHKPRAFSAAPGAATGSAKLVASSAGRRGAY